MARIVRFVVTDVELAKGVLDEAGLLGALVKITTSNRTLHIDARHADAVHDTLCCGILEEMEVEE